MRSRRSAVGAALVVAGWLAATGVAAAHDGLVSSSPADGQSVPTSPEQIQLEFSGELQLLGGGTALILTGPDGEVISGDLDVQGSFMRFSLGSVLPDAEYRVAYRVVSSDGHRIEGTTRFFVGPVPADAGSTAQPDGPGTGVPGVVVWSAGALALVGVALLVLRRSRIGRDTP